MAVVRCALLLVVAVLSVVHASSQVDQAKALVGRALTALNSRQGAAPAEARQAVEEDSYLAALEYSHNSAALQGETGGFSGFLRNVQNAISDLGFTRAGIAATVAVPLVAVGSLALLSPLALGRKKRDVDSEDFGAAESTDEKKEPEALERLKSRVTGIYSDVVNSEECVERFICEMGSAGKNVYYKDSIIRLVNYFAPSSYKKYLGTLKSAAYTADSSKCRAIKCTPIGL